MPNPHQKSIFLPIVLYNGLEDQNRWEATCNQKLATDSASYELTPTHNESLFNSHHELGQLTWAGATHHLSTWHWEGELALIWKSPENQSKSAGNPFDSPSKANWTSNPTSIYSFSAKIVWISRLELTLQLFLYIKNKTIEINPNFTLQAPLNFLKRPTDY